MALKSALTSVSSRRLCSTRAVMSSWWYTERYLAAASNPAAFIPLYMRFIEGSSARKGNYRAKTVRLKTIIR